MKTICLLGLCLLCVPVAFGQYGGASAAMSSGTQFADHSQHAGPQQMAQEQNLTGFGSVYAAQGEMPISEVRLPEVKVVPLGDVARAQKKEHETVKKARFVWEN